MTLKDEPLKCGCCCRGAREARKKARNEQFEKQWWEDYRKTLDRIAAEWTGLHAAFLTQSFDARVTFLSSIFAHRCVFV